MAERAIPFNQLAKAGYNRKIDRKRINDIKADYHEDMMQAIIVSFRDGKYWIVDGQHRAQALYEMNNCDPNTLIMCDVRIGLTYEEEADLFYRYNTGTKPLTFDQKLNGLIESNDENAVDFRNTVESCGYVLGKSLKAVSLAWKVYNRTNGKDTLTEILSLTNSCWPDSKSGADSRIIDGMSMFLKNHGDTYQRDHFIKVMSGVDPEELIKESTTFYKAMDSKSFTKKYCMYTCIVKAYNYSLRNKLTPVGPRV